MAQNDLERIGANPIEMLNEVYRLSIEAYKSGRGLTDKGDSGASYLAVAGKAAVDMARFKHPTLQAVAIQDITDKQSGKVMTTTDAVNIMKADPFAPKDIKEIPTERIVEAIDSKIKEPFLPIGEANDKIEKMTNG